MENLQSVNDPNQLDVIAVGAHPDDVEIGCGGTLSALVQQGYRVGIVDLTDGEPTPISPGPEVRRREAEQAASILGVQRVILDLPNRRLMDSVEARIALAAQFRRFRPKVVLGICDATPMASPDHGQARLITDAATFYSRLTKWDDAFGGLPPHRITRLAYYHLGFDLAMLANTAAGINCDISATYDMKIRAIRCYESQFPPDKESLFLRIDALCRALGQAAGVTAAERITPALPSAVTDLLATLLPGSGYPLPRR